MAPRHPEQPRREASRPGRSLRCISLAFWISRESPCASAGRKKALAINPMSEATRTTGGVQEADVVPLPPDAGLVSDVPFEFASDLPSDAAESLPSFLAPFPPLARA